MAVHQHVAQPVGRASNSVPQHCLLIATYLLRGINPGAASLAVELRCELLDKTMSNFDPNAIVRGAQLTVVGGQFAGSPVLARANIWQRTERFRTHDFLPQTITDKQHLR